MLLEAGMDALRAKGVALTGYAVSLFDAWLTGRGFALGSPRSAERRGSHVLIRHPDGQRLARALIDGGVIVDFRRPDGIRVGLAPLTTRFVDVHRAMRALADLAPA
jgi:kynureninase